jgi:hypothetical protein
LTIKDLQTKIEGAIELYNRYRSPEVTAELISVRKDRFIVSFKGTFCRTCGFYDYFEDFSYELLDEGKIKTRILTVKEQWNTEHFAVTYQIEETNLQPYGGEKPRSGKINRRSLIKPTERCTGRGRLVFFNIRKRIIDLPASARVLILASAKGSWTHSILE